MNNGTRAQMLEKHSAIRIQLDCYLPPRYVEEPLRGKAPFVSSMVHTTSQGKLT